MPRKLTTRQASAMAKARANNRGGRPRKPTRCPKCKAPCPSYRLAQVHCVDGRDQSTIDAGRTEGK